MIQAHNGMPATRASRGQLAQERLQQPERELRRGRGTGGGAVAVRNSRYSAGPALVYTPAEIVAFIRGVKDGQFDYLLG